MDLLKGTHKREVLKDETPPDKQAEYEKKAIESIGGSMVFVERKKLYHDSKIPRTLEQDNEDRVGSSS